MFPAYKRLETENLANGGDISVVSTISNRKEDFLYR